MMHFVCLLALQSLLLFDLAASSTDDDVGAEEYRVLSTTRQFVATAVLVVATIRGLLDSDDESDGEGVTQSRRHGKRDKARNRVR
jgi:hypothetical protein